MPRAKLVVPPGLGMRCAVVQEHTRCARCARRTRKEFWELRTRKGHANMLQVQGCCRQCDVLRYVVLNSAAMLTMKLMQAAVRGGMTAEESFWNVLVREREGSFGTNWEECPRCGQEHSVHTQCA